MCNVEEIKFKPFPIITIPTHNEGKVIVDFNLKPETKMTTKFTAIIENVEAIQFDGTTRTAKEVLSLFDDINCKIDTSEAGYVSEKGGYTKEKFDLQKGMYGVNIMRLQLYLNTKRANLIVDGLFGDQTLLQLKSITGYIRLPEYEFNKYMSQCDNKIKNIGETKLFVLTGINVRGFVEVAINDWIVKTEKYGYQIMKDVDFKNRYEINKSYQSLHV